MARVLAERGRVGDLRETLLMKLLAAIDPATQACLNAALIPGIYA